jgi:hypothetical protein
VDEGVVAVRVFTMRGGAGVTDPRLGRLHAPDALDRRFPMRAALADVPGELRSYTWNCYARLDQGNEGSCVGHGVAHELAARPVVVPKVTHPMAVSIYRAAQQIDEWPGDDYEGTSVRAGMKVAQQRGHYAEYRWADHEPDIAVAVAWRGPVVMGTNWYQAMFTPDADGFLRPDGTVAGGHCWLLIGLSLRRDAYRMLNSWGPMWGDNGCAWIARSSVARLLSEDGEGVLPLRTRVATLRTGTP